MDIIIVGIAVDRTTMYSISVWLSATTSCNVLPQPTATPPFINTNPYRPYWSLHHSHSLHNRTPHIDVLHWVVPQPLPSLALNIPKHLTSNIRAANFVRKFSFAAQFFHGLSVTPSRGVRRPRIALSRSASRIWRSKSAWPSHNKIVSLRCRQ